MSVRLVITDAMWCRIESLMPADPVRGRRWADHRRTLEAIAWKYRTGSPWRDLPNELGSFRTAHKRLLRWAMDGTWERILAAVLALDDADDDIGWTVSVDSTVVRAHQHAAGALKRGHQPEQSPLIMHSDARAAGSVQRSILPRTVMHGPWLSLLQQARPVMRRLSKPSWPASGCPEAAQVGPGPGR
ncbi:IS5 family transposase [Amycolatopsis mediterranei]|uniref:IS5 family transposase n=1 Tax=Amycolatopsis mediterranei TaxID=33910 RepID=UPI003428F9A1